MIAESFIFNETPFSLTGRWLGQYGFCFLEPLFGSQRGNSLFFPRFFMKPEFSPNVINCLLAGY